MSKSTKLLLATLTLTLGVVSVDESTQAQIPVYLPYPAVPYVPVYSPYPQPQPQQMPNRAMMKEQTVNKLILNLQSRNNISNINVQRNFRTQEPESICYNEAFSRTVMVKDSANHQKAYDHGYYEGKRERIEGKKYEHRTAGGEFARGYEDGFFDRNYAGQATVVSDRPVQQTLNQYKCINL
ncbi:hypothetical protein C7H19_15075 [Aphanothece hegewaldii CCALA 016]|uniref:Uncharacterized protein n=1 Tax=Aphanothece hegewaldii CCALA 016 TaxID=2107694 RepID=A0A2T1LW23_9CHRO|nr:hypothetical protein [Aphanothece hegewaldii]PSF36062.1 hypothetical protein C7H19_15075 [Aphanothece hegewaldii CCALA 016]